MNAEQKHPIHCPECGRKLTVTKPVFPHCGATIDVITHDKGNDNEAWTAWVYDGDKIKNQWVIAVVCFWVTVAIQVVVYISWGIEHYPAINLRGHDGTWCVVEDPAQFTFAQRTAKIIMIDTRKSSNQW